jgi:hypothetical protein
MPQSSSNKKTAVFSVVIRSVDHDITENDVKEELDSLELKIVRIWRIKSMKTNQFTPPNPSDNFGNGHHRYSHHPGHGRHHKCETSHTSLPIPVQWSRCFNRGHLAPNCPNRPICPTCPNWHPPNKWPLKHPKCPFCERNHPAWSLKSPTRHQSCRCSSSSPRRVRRPRRHRCRRILRNRSQTICRFSHHNPH